MEMKADFVTLINNRVIEMIRTRYSIEDEIGLLRTGPSDEAEVYDAFVEECLAWGRGEKIKHGSPKPEE